MDFSTLYQNWGMSESVASIVSDVTLAFILLLICFFINLISRRVLLRGLVKVAKKTKNTWDDRLVARGVFNKLAHIPPAITAYWGIPLVFHATPQVSTMLTKLVLAYMVIITATVILAAVEAAHDIYRTFKVSNDRPIKGYLQIVKLLVIIVAVVLVVTSILNVNPVGILSGLGAMSAVLILVFKDPLLGLVASVSLAANDMIRIGDWIEIPGYGADGEVIDITLQTIQVQNWDKTITSIPIYSLISGSFKNWRGMSESGGRRIKRSLNIDMTSVHFLDEAEISGLKQNSLITDYLSAKELELLKYREEHEGQKAPERKLTNLGTFRAYIEEYLSAHNEIHKNMTFIVRQLAPTPQGVPLEIYVFSANQVWKEYEGIQSDIFDHLIAAVPEFGLKLFQDPSGSDFRTLLK